VRSRLGTLGQAATLALALGAVVAQASLPVAAAPQVVAPAAMQIQLEVGKGRLVKLDRPASSVFLADPEIADIQVKSPTLVYVVGKGAGETTLFAVGDRDEVILNVGLAVRHNVDQLRQALHDLLPDSAIDVTSMGDALVLEGAVRSAAEAEDVRRVAARFVPDEKQLVNKLRIEAPNQVNIRVRVAEMSREVIKQLGFNWESVVAPGSFAFGLATGAPVLSSPVTVPPGTGPKQFLTQRAIGSGATVNNAFASLSTNRVDLNTLIDALDREGLVSILAEPNLTATSGETASFLAGGEFPIPVPQGLNTITIEFKKFGVSLDFQANIGAKDRISLRVRPEVSQLSNSGAITIDSITIPALTTRRADTTVELGSGQSFAIAGLLQNSITQNVNKFPGLGDLPVLGPLFRSSQFQRDETELVIIVTPYIVRPVSAGKLMAATDGFVAPTDAERYLKGATYRPQPSPSPSAPLSRSGATLIGPYGFDLQ
jgi:pilus assembly protein CpaC